MKINMQSNKQKKSRIVKQIVFCCAANKKPKAALELF